MDQGSKKQPNAGLECWTLKRNFGFPKKGALGKVCRHFSKTASNQCKQCLRQPRAGREVDGSGVKRGLEAGGPSRSKCKATGCQIGSHRGIPTQQLDSDDATPERKQKTRSWPTSATSRANIQSHQFGAVDRRGGWVAYLSTSTNHYNFSDNTVAETAKQTYSRGKKIFLGSWS